MSSRTKVKHRLSRKSRALKVNLSGLQVAIKDKKRMIEDWLKILGTEREYEVKISTMFLLLMETNSTHIIHIVYLLNALFKT